MDNNGVFLQEKKGFSVAVFLTLLTHIFCFTGSGIKGGKKGNSSSSDNLLNISAAVEYSRPKCTDALVREVAFALRYFEDAVVKGTYQMLPGCATVVLETVVNLQNYTVTKVSAIASRYVRRGYFRFLFHLLVQFLPVVSRS